MHRKEKTPEIDKQNNTYSRVEGEHYRLHLLNNIVDGGGSWSFGKTAKTFNLFLTLSQKQKLLRESLRVCQTDNKFAG